MNKQIVGVIMGIALISLVSALSYDLIAGEPFTFDLSETYEYYSIVGNSTIVDLNITQEGTIVTILTNKYSPADSFEIIFFNSKKEVITEHHYSSGRIRTITEEIIKEVPIYIDKEVVVEKEIPSEPEIIKKVPIWIYIIIALLTLFVLYLIFSQKESNSLEEEENINEKEEI